MRTRLIKRETGVFLGGCVLVALLSLAVVANVHAAITGPLAKSVEKGRNLFIHNTFGGQGLTCQSCHTAAGTGPTVLPNGMQLPSIAPAATRFPHYKARLGRVITLEDQVHGCIAGALGGKAPAYDSSAMRALISYLTSLSQGKRINMGARLQ